MTSKPTDDSALHKVSGRLLIVTALTVTAVAASACGSSSTGAGGSGSNLGNTLTLVSLTAPSSLNPAKNSGGAPEVFTDQAYDSLTHWAADGSFQPRLATAFGYQGTGNTQFKITLRTGVKFADGSPLDATAVKTYLEYFKTAGGPTQATAANIKSIDTPDPQTVLINLTTADANVPFYLSEGGHWGSIINPKALQNPDKLGTSTDGAGAYQLDTASTVTGSTYTYVRNQNAYDRAAHPWDKIVIKVISNSNTVLQTLRSGQAQVAPLDPNQSAVAKSGGLDVTLRPAGFSGLYLLDRAGTLVKGLGDVRVRQAINYALDRKTITTAIGGAGAVVNNQLTATGDIAHDPALDGTYAYDPAKAKSLLAEAGYASGFSFDVLIPGYDPLISKLAQAIASQLQQVGVKMRITSAASATDYLPKLLGGKYPAVIHTFATGTPTHVFRQNTQPKGALNPFHSTDPQVTALFNKAQQEPQDQVAATWKQLMARVLELAWFAPVMAPPLGYAYAKGLSGVDQTYSWVNPLYITK